jgi:hypothetical protein
VATTLESIRAAGRCPDRTPFEWRMFLNRFDPLDKGSRQQFLPAATKRDALLEEGVTIIDCGTKSGAVDMHLKDQLGSFVDDTASPPSHLVVIISGDKDFAGEYRKLYSAGFPSMMLHGDNHIAPGLDAVPAFVCPKWNRIVAKAGGTTYRFCPLSLFPSGDPSRRKCAWCSLTHSDGITGSLFDEQCREAAARTPCPHGIKCRDKGSSGSQDCLLDHSGYTAQRLAAACDTRAGDIVEALVALPELQPRGWQSHQKLNTSWAYAAVIRVEGNLSFVRPLGLSTEVLRAFDAIRRASLPATRAATLASLGSHCSDRSASRR